MEMVDLSSRYFALKVQTGFVFQQVKKGHLSSIWQVLVNAGTARVCVFSLLFENMRSEDPFWNSLSGRPGLHQNLKNGG